MVVIVLHVPETRITLENNLKSVVYHPIGANYVRALV